MKRRIIMVVVACALVVAALAPAPLPAGAKPKKSDPIVSIGKFLAKQATGKFAEFALDKSGVLDLLGNRTTLDDVTSQVQLLSTQVKALQQSADAIQRQLATIFLTQFDVPLRDLVSDVQSLYMNQFLPTFEALTNYALAFPSGNCDDPTSQCGKAKATFDGTLQGFLDAAARTEAVNTKIHNLLMPGAIGTSALSAFGAYVMRGEGATGLLTTADSNRVYAFYNYFGEYEALETFMQGVRNTVRYADLPLSMASFIAIQAVGYPKAEQDSLPPPIPADVFISLPQALAQRTSAKGVPMWLWDFKVGTSLAWDPSTPTNDAPQSPTCSRNSGPNRCTVPAAINTFNQTSAGLGFTGWHVPARAEWDGLLDGKFDVVPHDLRLFLLHMIPSNIQGVAFDQANSTNPFVWMSDTAKAPAISCHLSGSGIGDAGKVVPVAFTALGTGGTLRNYPAAYPAVTLPQVSTAQLQYPRGLTQSQGLAWCRQQLVSMVTAGFTTPGSGKQSAAGGQLVAVRTTTVNYMP